MFFTIFASAMALQVAARIRNSIVEVNKEGGQFYCECVWQGQPAASGAFEPGAHYPNTVPGKQEACMRALETCFARFEQSIEGTGHVPMVRCGWSDDANRDVVKDIDCFQVQKEQELEMIKARQGNAPHMQSVCFDNVLSLIREAPAHEQLRSPKPAQWERVHLFLQKDAVHVPSMGASLPIDALRTALISYAWILAQIEVPGWLMQPGLINSKEHAIKLRAVTEACRLPASQVAVLVCAIKTMIQDNWSTSLRAPPFSYMIAGDQNRMLHQWFTDLFENPALMDPNERLTHIGLGRVRHLEQRQVLLATGNAYVEHAIQQWKVSKLQKEPILFDAFPTLGAPSRWNSVMEYLNEILVRVGWPSECGLAGYQTVGQRPLHTGQPHFQQNPAQHPPMQMWPEMAQDPGLPFVANMDGSGGIANVDNMGNIPPVVHMAPDQMGPNAGGMHLPSNEMARGNMGPSNRFAHVPNQAHGNKFVPPPRESDYELLMKACQEGPTKQRFGPHGMNPGRPHGQQFGQPVGQQQPWGMMQPQRMQPQRMQQPQRQQQKKREFVRIDPNKPGLKPMLEPIGANSAQGFQDVVLKAADDDDDDAELHEQIAEGNNAFQINIVHNHPLLSPNVAVWQNGQNVGADQPFVAAVIDAAQKHLNPQQGAEHAQQDGQKAPAQKSSAQMQQDEVAKWQQCPKEGQMPSQQQDPQQQPQPQPQQKVRVKMGNEHAAEQVKKGGKTNLKVSVPSKSSGNVSRHVELAATA